MFAIVSVLKQIKFKLFIKFKVLIDGAPAQHVMNNMRELNLQVKML